MDIYNFIRSMIFLIAALILILFPKKVNKFQNYMLEKLHIKTRIKYERKYYFYTGIVFIIISIILFIFSIFGIVLQL